MPESKMNYNTITLIPLEPGGPGRKEKFLPWLGLLLGGLIGFLVVHPISMLVRVVYDYMHSGTPLNLGAALRHSFYPEMWPMIALYTILGTLVGITLGFILMRLKENRQRLANLHQEFELQVAALRHHYKNLAIGIQGFAGRVKRKLEDLEQHLQQYSLNNSPIQQECIALSHNVEILEEASQRLTQTLGQELFFLKALTSNSLSPGLNDINPLLRNAIRDLLELRFRDKEIRVEINDQPWDQFQDSLVFAFEPYTMEVILQNILSNAMKYGDFIRV